MEQLETRTGKPMNGNVFVRGHAEERVGGCCERECLQK